MEFRGGRPAAGVDAIFYLSKPGYNPDESLPAIVR